MYYSHSGEEAIGGNGLVTGFHKAEERSAHLRELISYHPVEGSLRSLSPVVLEMVSGSSLEFLWDDLVCEYHYLGYQKLLGHRLKYLAFVGDRPVGALSWSAAARKLAVRDRFIGWSEEQRKMYLSRVAANSRFLIMPWVRVPNLASYVLALNIRRLNRDWQERYQHSLWLVETFVDPLRFRGTCYRAANWLGLGQSYGSGKQGRGYVYHGAKKEVYLYVLEPRFREFIGCRQKRHSPESDSPRSITMRKMGELHMILKDIRWHSQMVPMMELTEEDVRCLAEELVSFHQQFHDCFGRIEHRRLGQAYLSGLLSPLEAKSVEPIALNFLGKSSVRSLQQFMKNYQWDHDAMLGRHQRMLSEMIASADGMLTVDSSEFIKKGKESVGVARQYCGAAGKVENCQSGVFVGYTSEKGYGLLHARLYLPQVWFSGEYEERRQNTGVPQDITFQTKPQIALDLLREISGTGLFPARWLGCDATFTSDPEFLASLPEGVYYFGSIRSNTRVYLEKPRLGLPPYRGRGRRPKRHRLLHGESRAQTVAQLAQSKRCRWTPVILAEGAKGPIVAEVARIRVYPATGEAAQEHSTWLFMRRSEDGQIKYAFSNAPEEMPFEEMIKASTMRWPIEQCFEEGKGKIGMDHYEHRSWTAWHRHMIYVFLGLLFLHRLRVRFKKNSCYDSLSSQHATPGSVAASVTQSKGGH